MWKRDQTVTPPVTPPDAPRETLAPKPPPVNETGTQVVMDLGKSVVIQGELSGSEDLTLYGQMEGTITLSNHTLTIGPDAQITANVSARAVVIMGALTGNVAAQEKVEIRAKGSVTGDIVSPRLAIADGGALHGKVDMPKVRRGA
jgi:cytoskeletal protein CcmA (bactofilin family)